MKQIVFFITIISCIFLIACSQSNNVDKFLDKYELVVKKYEDKKKVDSLKLYLSQINEDNQELLNISDDLIAKYPVSKWQKSQIDRFRDLGERFMFLRLDAGEMTRTPLPYEGNIRFSH